MADGKDKAKDTVKIGGPAAAGTLAGALLLGPVGAAIGGLIGLGIGITIKVKTDK